MKFCAAIDLGASSGRIAVGSLDSGSLVIQEVHRFKHEAKASEDGGLRWEWAKIVAEVKTGLLKAQEFGEIISTIFLVLLTMIVQSGFIRELEFNLSSLIPPTNCALREIRRRSKARLPS